MSSQFHSAAVTTAMFIDVGMKPLGGRVLVSIRILQLARSGSKATRCRSEGEPRSNGRAHESHNCGQSVRVVSSHLAIEVSRDDT